VAAIGRAIPLDNDTRWNSWFKEVEVALLNRRKLRDWIDQHYDELGDVYSLLQQDREAERSYRDALRREPRLLNSYLGLAKIYQREEKYQQSLAALDSAARLDPGRPDIHYLRGQVLVHVGRKD